MEILLKLSSVDLELMQIYKHCRAKTGGEIYGFSVLVSGLPRWLSGKESACHMETWVRPLGWEDSLKKGKATHSSVLARRIPCTVWSMGSQRVGQD